MTFRPAGRRSAARSAIAVVALLTAGASAGCTILPPAVPAGSAIPTPAGSSQPAVHSGATASPTSSPTSSPTTSSASGSAADSAMPEQTLATSAVEALTDLATIPDLPALLVPAPDPAVLDPLLDEALALQSGTMSAAVRDGLTGELLYDQDADKPVVPASAVKVLTAVAALEVLGPEHRYTTSAVELPVGGDRTAVVLDAGGDVMLGTGANGAGAYGRAGLGSLAYSTAKALQKGGTTGTVSIRLDDTGYEGPGASPAWSSDIVTSGNASTVQPLATYGGRPWPGESTGRLHDPALYAAEVFRRELAAHAANLGVDITVAEDVARVALEGRGTELASVDSAPVEEQMTYMLRTSDNQVAEATGRNLALAAGAPGSFDGAARTIEKTLAGLEVDTTGLELVDASGLSHQNRVSAGQLTSVLQAATTVPRLGAAATGLPAAGGKGTLEYRMVGTAAEGAVRAKTGTLSSVASLTGTVETEDGRTLLFSFMANGQPGVLDNARFAVDRAAVVLADCGCRDGS